MAIKVIYIDVNLSEQFLPFMENLLRNLIAITSIIYIALVDAISKVSRVNAKTNLLPFPLSAAFAIAVWYFVSMSATVYLTNFLLCYLGVVSP